MWRYPPALASVFDTRMAAGGGGEDGGWGGWARGSELLCDTFPCLPFETQSVALACPFALPLLVERARSLLFHALGGVFVRGNEGHCGVAGLRLCESRAEYISSFLTEQAFPGARARPPSVSTRAEPKPEHSCCGPGPGRSLSESWAGGSHESLPWGSRPHLRA